MKNRKVTIPDPIANWSLNWDKIPGAFWLQHEHESKKADMLCIPLSHRRAVTESSDDESVYLVTDKNQTFVDMEPGLRVIPAFDKKQFQKISFSQAQALSIS
jgi:hypothetical protein